MFLESPQLVLIVAGLLGLCVGSFANVLIYRLPRNLGVAAGRSACPDCRITIAWYDNLPLVSWLALRGRCRHCGKRIPVRYLLIELFGGACALLAVWRFGANATGAGASFLLLWLLVVAVIDWQHMIIPHTVTLSGIAVGLTLSPLTGLGWLRAVTGLVIGALAVLALSYGYRLWRGRIGMGGGDVMLMAMVGAFLGPWAVAVVLCLGSFLGTLFILIRHGGKIVPDAKLPFGTFLSAAAALVVFVGEPVGRWYLGLFS